MPGIFHKAILDPYPLRTLAKLIIKELKLYSYKKRIEIGAVERPHYGYIVYNAAMLAKKLGYKKISVLEFGVAGGNGILNLEYHAEEVSKLTSVDIEIYGFDTGEGLPKPVDYRDLPYLWKEGFFKMDYSRLYPKLKRTKLVLGDIRQTSLDFFEKYNPAPIGAISYDLDFYSSTVTALKMLEANEKNFLPRLFCYFDDIRGDSDALYNQFTGERLAINEFNSEHKDIKLDHPYYLLANKVVEPWYHEIFICHFFAHNMYSKFISFEDNNLKLKE